MDIKERLKLLESLPSVKTVEATAATTNLPKQDAGDILSGQTITTPVGKFLKVKRYFPGGHRHGSVRLTAFLENGPPTIALLAAKDALLHLDLRRTLFIDTETTGLSGGVGTCAFLVGVGYFNNDDFVVEQFFMRDFDEEHALFQALTELVQGYDLLVSYNGKSYDIPLLNSRHIYQGLQARFDQMQHLDLLHCVRRLWKHTLDDCRLTTAEEYLVQLTRDDDIPGFLIPYTYFEYLRTRDASPLASIFEHNRLDILTMVALIIKATEVLENPIAQCKKPGDLLQVGRIYETAGRLEDANNLYQEYLSSRIIMGDERDILFRLALNHKKLGDAKAAATVWRRCIETQRYHPLPYVELAKHEEHREKCFYKARQIVEQALKQISIQEALGTGNKWYDYKEDLEYRKIRIENKLAREKRGVQN